MESEFEIVSAGRWLLDERLSKTCSKCAYRKRTEFAWLCKPSLKQFGIMDSPYHMTCREFKMRDNDACNDKAQK